MKQATLLCVLSVLGLTCSLQALAQEKGTWRAVSKTASSITGDIALSADKLSIAFAAFPIAPTHTLNPDELKATFDLDAVPTGSGNLYRLNIPAARKFLHKNTLCGSEDTQWMVTYVAGRDLHLAFFSGPKIPILTAEAVMNSTNLCGTYLYTK